jgi:hypothetical protein
VRTRLWPLLILCPGSGAGQLDGFLVLSTPPQECRAAEAGQELAAFLHPLCLC